MLPAWIRYSALEGVEPTKHPFVHRRTKTQKKLRRKCKKFEWDLVMVRGQEVLRHRCVEWGYVR